MLSISDTPAAPPPPSPFNMAAYVLAQADRVPDKTALAILSMSGAQRWRYGALRDAVAGIAGGLLAQGLVPGDRVLLRLGNSAAFPLAYLGAIWAGLVPVPTAAGLTVPEITKLAQALTPRLIVADPEVALPDARAATVLPAKDLMRMRHGPPVPADLGDPERPAYIVFTSGTSGSARGVVHAHRAVWARRMMWQGWYGLSPDDRLMHAGAFNWTYTMGTGLMDPWAMGATALIPAPEVTPVQLPLLMARHQATVLAAAPGIYRQMLKAPLPPLPALRHGLSAGEALPGKTARDWRAATGCAIFEAFGMSECSTFISAAPTRPAPDGACGFAQPGRRVALVCEDGAPVPVGEPGIIAVDRDDPGLMLGYLDAPEATAARMRDTWFLTGDTAVMDAGGAITYLGREDDMMNAGGFRVSPLEVEAAALALPGIEAAAAIEERVKEDASIIALHYVGAVDQTALDAHLCGLLAPYKRPRRLIRADSLPHAGNGKINRRALRDVASGGGR